MRAVLAVVVLLVVGAPSVSADPITLSNLSVVQLAPTDPTINLTDGPFLSDSQTFTVFADLSEASDSPLQLLLGAPLGTVEYAIPLWTNTLAMAVTIPRVYRPTTFHAEATLLRDGVVLDTRSVEWTASSPVPEPGTFGVMLAGLLGLYFVVRHG
jgi:hypothetical protein